MSVLKKKVQNNNGSSMILALALLLICVMVSSVIITAATSGVSRNYYRTSQQQNYLAISSATDFIVDNFNITTDKFVGTEISGKKPCQQYIDGEETWLDDPTTSEVNDGITVKKLRNVVHPSGNTIDYFLMDTLCEETEKQKKVESIAFAGVFSELMEKATEKIYMGAVSYTEEIELSVTNHAKVEDDRVPKVSCEFTMKADYSIQIRVTSADEDGDDENIAYAVLINIPAEVVVDNTKTQQVECSHEHKLYERRKTADGSGVENYTTYLKLPAYEIENITEVVVTWGVPVVTKEVITP